MKFSVLVSILSLVTAGAVIADPMPLDRAYPPLTDTAKAKESYQNWVANFHKSSLSIWDLNSNSSNTTLDESARFFHQDQAFLTTLHYDILFHLTATANGVVLHEEYKPFSMTGMYSDKDVEAEMARIADSLPQEITGQQP